MNKQRYLLSENHVNNTVKVIHCILVLFIKKIILTKGI